MTKDIQILRNFAYKGKSFVKGEHIRINEEIANFFIEVNFAAECEHEHEGDGTPVGVLEVPQDVVDNPTVAMKIDIPTKQPKSKKGRKKVTKDE